MSPRPGYLDCKHGLLTSRLPRAPPLTRKRGHSGAGAARTRRLDDVPAKLPVLDATDGQLCRAGTCTVLVGVECLSAGQAPCAADEHGNLGSGNAGSNNFGRNNIGNGNIGECWGLPIKTSAP